MIWILLGIIHGLCAIGNLIYSYKEEGAIRSDGWLYALIPVISQGLLAYRILFR